MELQENINRIKGLINVISEQNSSDEFDSLVTSGITDTGLQAPFTDEPKIASGTDTISISERQPSNITKNENLRRPWGDPYIYYKAKDGKYYAYRCGKEARDKIKPCPVIKREDWKDANPYKEAIERLVFTNNNANSGSSGSSGNSGSSGSSGSSGNAGQSNIDYNEIKNNFRNRFYEIYAYNVSKILSSTIIEAQKFPEYKIKLETPDLTGAKEESVVDLLNVSNINIDNTINYFTDYYTKNPRVINSNNYQFKKYVSQNDPVNQICGLSEIFKPYDGYLGHEEVKNKIKNKGLVIVKV